MAADLVTGEDPGASRALRMIDTTRRHLTEAHPFHSLGLDPSGHYRKWPALRCLAGKQGPGRAYPYLTRTDSYEYRLTEAFVDAKS